MFAPSRLALRAFLVALLALSTAQVLYVARQDARTGRAVAEKALEATALALSASAERALRAGGGTEEMRGILSDRIVAYALISDRAGVVRFHTNPGLVGTRLTPLRERPDRPVGRRVHLGTGVPAYELWYPLHGGPQPEELVVVLHTTPIDGVAASSRSLHWGLGVMVTLLWATGLAVDRLAGRLLAVRDEMARRERLTLVGHLTATLSHEIRNAVGGVKGYAQWIDEKTGDDDPRKRGLASILRGTARIEGLVDDLLRFSREENYHLEAVPAGPAVAEAVRAGASAWGGELAVAVPEGLSVLADAEKLGRALVNAVRNAVQAMPHGGTLSLTVAPGRGGRVVFEIADTGSGLPEEAREKLFTPFFTTKADGTGLGLAYSKKVIEGMGGTISLGNGARGAVLAISLPAA
ncbi:MAG: sensor histidine kinase [Deferrisomatales bacterium]